MGLTLLSLLLACAVEPPAPGTTAPDGGPADGGAADGGATLDPTTPAPPAELSPMQVLFRASLDLRGVRPSLEEIQAVEADPAQVDVLIDRFLYDERFGDRVVAMFSEIYQTEADTLLIDYSGVSDDLPGLIASIGEEPLRLLAWIAVHDLPYTDVVTADWTVADHRMAQVWPLDYPEGATGWQQVRYTDDRPAAGILSTNSLWWRYTSTLANGNRGRANAISRILFCNDYLSKPIEFDRDVNLLDEGAVNDALQTNQGCIACHNTLDPLASYLWGFYYTSAVDVDVSYYHPEREYWWEDQTGVAPGFYGQPSYHLEDLSQQIAADPRLIQCVTEQVFEQLLQRQSTLDDTSALTALRETLLQDDLRLRSLIRAAMLRPEYRAAEGASASPAKLTRPELLASQLEDLTGFRFTTSDHDMLTSDTYGLRTLAGGIDGGFVTSPSPQANATMALSWERVAQAASWYVVQQDRADPGQARLFTEIGFTETPATNRPAMEAQVQHLHLRLFGTRVLPDGEEVTSNLELWEELYQAEGDPAAAWAGLLSVLLRDPAFLFY